MKYLNQRVSVNSIFSLLIFSTLLIAISCGETSIKYNDIPLAPISKSEITEFQNAYGASFNEIAAAIESETYYELKAKEHINGFYNFEDGEVMFKIGYENEQPFRYSHGGLLSYLIGKSKDFPMDIGIAKENWRKMNWNNMGTIIEGNIAIVIGKVTMENESKTIDRNFTMVLKRNNDGKIKLITHQISIPC